VEAGEKKGAETFSKEELEAALAKLQGS
jgi:hypothetical protein